jgi:hypothetical protein
MPEEADEEREEQDKAASGYIEYAVSEKFLNLLEEDAPAYRMWTTLRDIFNKQDTAKWLDYVGKLSSLTKSAEESITDYVSRAQDISAMLSGIGKPVAEAEVVGHLLRGLPEDYEIWRAIMRRSAEPELTYNNFLNLMLEADETLARQGRRVDVSMTSTAMFTKANYHSKHRGSFNGQHQQHQQRSY